jgi:uncharacterized protein (TIGR03435 family)
MRMPLALAGFMILASSLLSGQSSGQFDVASVKRAEAPQRPMGFPSSLLMQIGFEGGPGTNNPGRIFYHQVPLKMLIAHAFEWDPDRINGPSWLDSEYYTVEAKVPPATTKDQAMAMLRSLIEERFQLKLHRDEKVTSVYRLKVAKNGPKLQPPVETTIPDDEEARKEFFKKQADDNRARTKALDEARAAATARGEKPRNSRSFGTTSATTEQFADALSKQIGIPVRDMTGIEGKHSFNLHWNPESPASATVDDGAPETSIFAAVKEQLGLQLEPAKDAVGFLVIDSVRKEPASN